MIPKITLLLTAFNGAPTGNTTALSCATAPVTAGIDATVAALWQLIPSS